MRPVLGLVPPTLAAGLVLAACTADRPAPTAPATTTAMATPALSADVSGPATPPFNDEIILRAVGDGSGFGHVKFRQPKDEELVVHLDVWVRDLGPNHSYLLQRAVDTNVNDDCTGTSWLTLGKGLVPEAIATDETGTGRANLFRNLASIPPGTEFDIHFRVIDATTSADVLESACYQYRVSQ